MMMVDGIHRNPTIDVPPWSPFDDPAAGMEFSLQVSGTASGEYLRREAALQGYLPANEAAETEAEAEDPAELAYSCDEFRMYEFKVRRCARGKSHDWTECPYAHPGEKARRRDPRKHHYSGAACPDFRKGSCKKGDSCEFAHGVFECWLHPARYRTQACKDGTACRRRVCFFAHTQEQLRFLPSQLRQGPRAPDSYDGSPLRHHSLDGHFDKGLTFISPPLSPPGDSPPIGVRRASWPMGSSVNEVLASLRKLQLSKVKLMPSSFGGVPDAVGFSGGFCSLPTTPTRPPVVDVGGCWLDMDGSSEEEVPMERVESGRALRAKMYERLSKETGIDRADGKPATAAAPNVGLVSELVK